MEDVIRQDIKPIGNSLSHLSHWHRLAIISINVVFILLAAVYAQAEISPISRRHNDLEFAQGQVRKYRDLSIVVSEEAENADLNARAIHHISRLLKKLNRQINVADRSIATLSKLSESENDLFYRADLRSQIFEVQEDAATLETIFIIEPADTLGNDQNPALAARE